MLRELFKFIKRYPFIELARSAISDPLLVWEYQRRTVTVSCLPARMMIDPCNICYLECKFCPTGYRQIGATKATMSFELFQHIVRLNPRVRYIDLYGWGEPFLCIDIFRMIEFCRKQKIRTNIHSNLSFCGYEFIERIIETPPSRLCLTVDGASQDTCEKYQVGINFDRAKNNMEHLSKCIKKADTRIEIQWKFLYHKYNYHEIEQAEKLANQWDFNFVAYPLNTPKSQKDEWHQPTKVHESTTHTGEGFDIACPHLWLRPKIDPRGYFTFCCASYFDDDKVGENLSNLSNPKQVLELWNSSSFRRGRACFQKSATFTEIKKPILCEICCICKRYGGLDPRKHPEIQESIFAARRKLFNSNTMGLENFSEKNN